MTNPQSFTTDIAIIGLAGRFPGSRNISEYWRHLREGAESVSFFTDEELVAAGVDPSILRNPRCVKARAVVAGVEEFDAAFFGISAREAEIMDPQHRIFLECSWECLEDAGYDPGGFKGRIGVFGGESVNSYLSHNLLTNPQLLKRLGPQQIRNGNRLDNLCTRVSYKLNLKGPGVTVQTSCSTSLVAIHLACQSLLCGESDIALAGGVSAYAQRQSAYLYVEGGVGSPDGHCRAFDAKAEGFVPGEGCGVIALKPLRRALADGDHVYAVIKGSAINNDGSDKIGYTAPSIDGQAEVISEALAMANISAETIGYIETHGTGTPLGDPIEITALTQAFRREATERGRCAIGSVKTNIGHLDAAAGVAGLIKTVLALKHQELPPSLHFDRPNPKIDFENSPFFVNTELRPWNNTATPRRAGVSSFGIGGTNAHIVLEEAPPRVSSALARPWQLILLSSRSNAALENMTDNLVEHLKSHPDEPLADVAFTLQTGRRRFGHRRALVCDSTGEAIVKLTARDPRRVLSVKQEAADRQVVFMFPGQGAQVVNMGLELYQTEPLFREKVDYCAEVLQARLGFDLRETLYLAEQERESASELINQTLVAQPALFVTEYALACLWMEWGVRPQALIGHSLGEYVAACLAGVFSLEEALELVAARARLMQLVERGAMLSVPMAEAEVRELLDERCSIAAVNAKERCVISGPTPAIESLERRLSDRGIRFQRLQTSHAFHSAMIDPILDEFAAQTRRLNLQKPRIPYLSNVTGKWITDSEARDPEYWVRHLRQTVRFAQGVKLLLDDQPQIFLEVGPGRSLSALARQNAGHPTDHVIVSSLNTQPGQDSESFSLRMALGQLWLNGVEINWSGFYGREQRLRHSLPTYPFERQRYWVEPLKVHPPQPEAQELEKDPVQSESPFLSEEIPPIPSWGKDARTETSDSVRFDQVLSRLKAIVTDLLGIEQELVTPQAGFFELGFDSLQLMRVSQSIEQEFGLVIAFRQLFEQFSNLESLTAHIAQSIAVETSPECNAAPAEQNDTNDASPFAVQLSAPSQLSNAGEPEVSAVKEGDNFGPWRPVKPGQTWTLTDHQQSHLSDLVRRHTRRTAGSKQMAQQFRSTLADNRNAVGFRQIWKELVYPIIAERSSGARMWDVDGNEYLDLVMGFGVNLFGHSPHFVTEALETQLKKGIQIGPQTRLAGEVAELIRELTGMERVNFCNTGSEAVMGALRIARTVTGRNKIAIFAGSYHGISDGVLARAKTVNGTRQTVPVALGIPQQMISQVVVLDYNRPESLDYIRAHAGEFAATLVEPVQSSRPDIQPKEFLLALRELTREAGIALIFDEMVTGFRIHPGGAQAWFGIQADLATYGKIVGGGMPIGVIAGKAAYLDAIDGGTWSYGDASYPKANQTFLAGTFCKHPLALAASKAVLTHLKQTGPALQQMLNERTALITNSLNDYCQQARLPMHVRSFGSLFRLNFSHEANFGNLLFYHLLNQGIHLWEGRNCFLSTAHTDEDIRYIVQTIKQCLEELRKGDFIPCGDGRANTVQTPTAGLAAGKEGRKPDAARGASEEGTGERLLPMTDSQKGLWAVAQMSSQACAAFNETINLRLRGELDAELLRQALQRVVERHGALRTTFSQDGESQRISPSITLDTPLIDYSSVPGDEKDACLTRWFKAEAERPFDLAEGPLLRTTLIKTREREHYLALTIHHLVTDGWSVSIFQRELWAFYKALRSGQDCQLPTPYSFGDYAQAQSNDDENEGLAQAESYWIQKFAGEVPRLNLPTDRPRPRIQTYQGNRKRLVIPRELRPALNKFASSQNSTLFITLLSCFQVLLHQISGQEDIIAGIHSAGQAAMGGKHLMGFCINTLPLRNRISWDETFTDQLSRTKQDVFAAQKHQNYSLRRLVKRLQLVRDPGRPPLIPVIFNLDRSRGADSDTQIAGLEVSRIPSSTVFARFDLLWNAVETDTQLVVDCTYNTDLFDARTIEGWMDRYGKLLELVALTPKIKVAELVTALSAAESQRKYEEETNLKQARLRKFRELRKPAINSPTS